MEKITRERSIARVRAVLEAAEDCAVMIELKPNEILFYQGDEARNVYVVKSGLIDIVDEKDQKTVVTLKQGDLLGETALLLKTTRNATARVSSDGNASLLKVDQKRFMNLIATELRAELAKSKIKSFDRTMRNR
jgi:CRP-like cAMP-binding protein